MPPAVRMAKWASARAFVLCVVAALGLALQTTQAIGQSFQFGAFTMVKDRQIANNELLEPAVGKRGFTYEFLTKVGGVSFETVAALPAKHSGHNVCPRYVASNADGERLVIEIGPNRYSTSIYDWQLIPIANYADSEFVSLVSLFGPHSRGRILHHPPLMSSHVVYHPSVENTLLGLRLLHGDVLLIAPYEFGQLPKMNGSVPLGAGETDFTFSEVAAGNVKELLKSFGNRIRAWVITDVDRTPQVVVEKGHLSVALEPYFYFWGPTADIVRMLDERDELVRDLLLTESGFIVPRRDQSYWSKDFIKMQIDQLSKKIDRAEEKARKRGRFATVVEATKAFDLNSAQLMDLNPPVIDALRTTARFAALFRLAKQTDAVCWQNFVADISELKSFPEVGTPNVWHRPLVDVGSP